jgi:S-adenosylmethionine uptake transporter
MLVASLCFACMGVCVKLGAQVFSAAELVFWRGAIATVLLYAFIRMRGWSLATPHWRRQIDRGLSGFVSLVMYFYAIAALPLATAVTLNYTSPLFLAVLLIVLARERLRPRMLAALAVGFAGVVLLLQPTLREDQLPAGLIGLGSGLLAGLAYYNVRRLGALGEPEWRTVFYFSLIATLGGLPWVLLSTPAHAYDWRGVGLLLGIGLFGAAAQLAMTRAYRFGKTLVSASLAYSTVVFSSLFGLLFWGDALPWPAWFGIALIVASGLMASMYSGAVPARIAARASRSV